MIERKSWGFIIHGEPEQLGPHLWRRRDLAFVAPGGFSSIHLHRHLKNSFRVLHGSITVSKWDRGAEVDVLESGPDRAIPLSPCGGRIVLPEGKIHCFYAGPNGAVIEEIYTCEGSMFAWDITRFDEGGIACQSVRESSLTRSARPEFD